MREDRPATVYAACDDPQIVTAYYNPAGYCAKRANYERFAAPLRAAGIPLVTVECVFGAQPFAVEVSIKWLALSVSRLLFDFKRLGIGVNYSRCARVLEGKEV